jgi:adenylate cyclase
VQIYEPLGLAGEVPAERRARAEAYAEGLARCRQRDFGAAAQHFAHVADADPRSARLLERAQELARHPPGPDWQPINVLDEK